MAPKKPPAPPPRPSAPSRSPAPAPTGDKSFTVSAGKQVRPLKVCIYGTGGIGKSELAANLSQLGLKVLFFDLEAGTAALDVQRAEGIESFDDLRNALHSEELCGQFDAIVIDSLTKAEELAVAWTLANVRHEKGHLVTSIEGYGFGKGTVHVYETFLTLIGDLDAQARRGRHVITIAHECVANVPNPAGEDWIRYEPRLQSPASGKSSIRHRIKEWADHLLYIGYDTHVTDDGKGVGSGSRCIYPTEMPTYWAKSRTLSEPIVYDRGSAELWNQLIQKGV